MASNRTTEMADRDKRANWLESTLNEPVSGSESKDLNPQDPAESRAFLGVAGARGEQSLLKPPQWRWVESGANSSLAAIP